MTIGEKKEHVESILSVDAIFDDILDEDEKLIHFRPNKDAWTIHEHIVHCLDVDISNFTRYRKGIVQPGSEITSMDESWTNLLNYDSINIKDAIMGIKVIRKITYSHLITIVDNNWKEYSFLYDKYGLLDFETVIPAFTGHPQFHRKLVDRNINLYKNL